MPRVLVVDNDDDIRESARFLLEEAGYEVIEAPDGAVALDLLRGSDQPLVVLLDIVMPRRTGVDILKIVEADEHLARHAFVVWTASRYPVPPGLLAALDAPLVPKPFDVEELLAVVADATERLDREQSA